MGIGHKGKKDAIRAVIVHLPLKRLHVKGQEPVAGVIRCYNAFFAA